MSSPARYIWCIITSKVYMVCHHQQGIYGVSSQAKYIWCVITSKVSMVFHHKQGIYGVSSQFLSSAHFVLFYGCIFLFFFTHMKTYVNLLMIIVCLTPQLSVVKCLTLASRDLASEILQTVHHGSLH